MSLATQFGRRASADRPGGTRCTHVVYWSTSPSSACCLGPVVALKTNVLALPPLPWNKAPGQSISRPVRRLRSVPRRSSIFAIPSRNLNYIVPMVAERLGFFD